MDKILCGLGMERVKNDVKMSHFLVIVSDDSVMDPQLDC